MLLNNELSWPSPQHPCSAHPMGADCDEAQLLGLVLCVLCVVCTAGGWGPAVSSDPSISIPSKDVLILNNLLVNPSNESAKWSHFSVRSLRRSQRVVGRGVGAHRATLVCFALLRRAHCVTHCLPGSSLGIAGTSTGAMQTWRQLR